MFNETINLILKHSDIDTDPTKDTAVATNGYWINGKQKTVFYVNMRRLLGDMWNKYDDFVLRLNQFSNGFSTYATTVNVDNQWIINVSGLNWINATYYQPSGNNQQRYQMLMVLVPNNAAQTFTYGPNVSICNFKKDPNKEVVELTFEFLRMLDNGPVVGGNTEKIPHCGFNFDIYPVKKI